MNDISPNSDAILARVGLNASIVQWVSILNKKLAAQYAEYVSQWVSNKQQLPVGSQLVGPIPVPAKSWVVGKHVYTSEEVLYDARFPGLPPLTDEYQVGPPVAEQYVEPIAPAQTHSTKVHVGSFIGNGRYAAMPDDDMPDGYLIPATDGVILRKVIHPTPWGSAQWYEVV